MTPKELENALYSTRLLVFIEIEPQSNKYHQIILDAKRFKKVSKAVIVRESKSINGDIDVELIESEDIYTLPDLKEIYTDDEINEIQSVDEL